MRALTWLVGVLVILLGFGAAGPRSSWWTAVWVSAAVLWLFVGVGLGVVSIAKLAAGKLGAGLTAASTSRAPKAPAPRTSQAGPGPSEGFDGG
jgi:hypothetical protein